MIIEREIKKRYKSLRQFAQEVDIPYTTLKSALIREDGIEKMAVERVIRICHLLDLDVNTLMPIEDEFNSNEVMLSLMLQSDKETELLEAPNVESEPENSDEDNESDLKWEDAIDILDFSEGPESSTTNSLNGTLLTFTHSISPGKPLIEEYKRFSNYSDESSVAMEDIKYSSVTVKNERQEELERLKGNCFIKVSDPEVVLLAKFRNLSQYGQDFIENNIDTILAYEAKNN